MSQNPARTPARPPASTARAALPAYAVGIVNFRTYEDLDRCLASLAVQSHAPCATLVIDHDADDDAQARVAGAHPAVRFSSRPNTGFAGGANAALALLARRHREAEFVLLLNPDVALEPDYARTLLTEMTQQPRAALASGKLLRPDGVTLDSAGIRMARHRRPRDRGAGELDRSQFDRCETVFGVSGAAMLLRRAALPDLEIDGEIFDEDFFAYHEDTDLAWRAGLLGWECLYVPEARATHGRRWRPSSRFAIETSVRRHSFKNHYLEMVKNERPGPFMRDLPVIAAWEVLRLGYSLLRDRSLLRGYPEAIRLLPRAWAKRRIIQQRSRTRSTPNPDATHAS